MAHFAELDHNNIVKRVIVVSDKDTSDENGIEDENIGISFCKSLYGQNTRWKQTSYNNKIRRSYAGIGFIYNEQHDVFILPQPFQSWILNEETAYWEAPTPQPQLTQEEIDNRASYFWDEGAYEKNGITGWVLFTPNQLQLEPVGITTG